MSVQALLLGISGIDADAQAFITAAGISDTAQKNAIIALVADLKSFNLWSKLQAVYPFVGGTSTTHKFNLKNPADSDAAFRLVFSGGWTHSATGALPNGTTGYADTKYNQNTHGTVDNEHISVYSRTNTTNPQASQTVKCEIGCASTSGGNGSAIFARRGDTVLGDVFYTRSQTVSLGNTANSDSRGFFLNSRTVNTEYRSQKNATSTTHAISRAGRVSSNFFIGARNFGGADAFSDREIAFASIGLGLTETEAGNLYTAIQTFQTALSRNV